MFSKRKSGYLEGLAESAELSELHRSFIPGILQIRVVAVVICSVFICSVTDLRGWSCSGDVGALLDPQSLIVPIYLLTGPVIPVTQPVIVSSPFLVGLRKVSLAVSVR